MCCNPAKLKEEIHNYLLNPAELCCTMKKVYKNFIIGDKNVKKRKTPGAQTRACEKRKLVYTDEDVAAGAAYYSMRYSLRRFWSGGVCICKVE